MGAIEKGGVVIMRIDAVQLALLCASHFIIFFSYPFYFFSLNFFYYN